MKEKVFLFVKEMTEIVGANSLFFLSLNGTYKAMGCEKRNPKTPQFTDHCFTGDYPTTLMDQSGEENIRQLSLLFETEKE